MKSSEFVVEAHLTDPKEQPKPGHKMKPRKQTPKMFEADQLDEINWKKALATGATAAAMLGGNAHALPPGVTPEMMDNLKYSTIRATGVYPSPNSENYLDPATFQRIARERGDSLSLHSTRRAQAPTISPEEHQAIRDKAWKKFHDDNNQRIAKFKAEQETLKQADEIAKEFAKKLTAMWHGVPERSQNIKPGFGSSMMMVFYNQQGQYVGHDVMVNGADDMGNESRYGKNSTNMNAAIQHPSVLAKTKLPPLSDEIFDSIKTPKNVAALSVTCGPLGCKANFTNH